MNSTLDNQLDFENLTDFDALQIDPVKLEKVQEVFCQQIEVQDLHPAAQMVVLRKGQVVLDLVGGKGRGNEVTPQTPFLGFSMTKAFTGMCIHKLIEEGKVEMDAPIAEYWPEFGCKGKEIATIKHVFQHKAGIPSRYIYPQIPLLPFWGLITRSVANLPAEFEPGSKTAYHLLNYGVIFGEVVRRVSGLPFPQYLRENFLDPLGLKNTWIGNRPGGMQKPLLLSARDPNPLKESWFTYTTAWIFNTWPMRNAIMPAANLHSTAREVAIFYQMVLNGGQYAGKQLVKPETIKAATALSNEDFDHTIMYDMRWAHGFYLGGGIPPKGLAGPEMGWGSSRKTFGHFGMATSMAWADPEADLVVVFTCNRMLDKAGAAKRYTELSDAVWDSLTDYSKQAHVKHP